MDEGREVNGAVVWGMGTSNVNSVFVVGKLLKRRIGERRSK